MNDKWKVWDSRGSYGEVLYKRAIGELPEMESSKKIAKVLRQEYRPGEKILDVGCGAGHYLRSLRREIGPEFNYTGADATAGYLDLARKAFADDRQASFVKADIFALGFETASYDIVTCNNVLLHLPSIAKPLAELVRVAKRKVIVRLLAGDRSFRIMDITPTPNGDDFEESGEPKNYHFHNIYGRSYIEKLLGAEKRVKGWKLELDQDFDKDLIERSVSEHGKAHDATKVFGNMQVNGYVIQPWSILEIDLS